MYSTAPVDWAIALCKMQTALLGIWTWIAVSTPYNGNYNTASTFTHTHTHIYIYIYISHPSQLFRVARHARFLKLGSKPSSHICQPRFNCAATRKLSVNEGILNTYVSFVLFTYIHLTATESSIHLKSLVLHKWQPLLPLLFILVGLVSFDGILTIMGF